VLPVVSANIPSVSCIGTSTANITPITLTPFTTVTPNYCSLNWAASAGVAISNTTTQAPTFTITGLGTFTLTLTVVNENGTTSLPLSITTTTCADVSVKEIGLLSGVSVFPNPATENTSIKFFSAAATDINVTVSDITGKTVLSVVNTSSSAGLNEINIPSSELQSGVYFVTLFTGSSKETVKLIVNH
jgi:PKD repeat protein